MKQSSVMQNIRTHAAKNNIPLEAFVVLTERCHLRCDMCYLVENPRPEMSTPEVFDVLEQLQQLGSTFIAFTGGEPLLRSDCFDILSHARDLGFMTTLYTTATPCNAERVKKLKESGLFCASVSLYAVEPALHDIATGVPGSFEKTMEGCKRLIDAGIRVQFKFLQMGLNVGQLIPSYELARSLGASFSYNFNLTACHDGRRESLSHQLNEEVLLQIQRTMTQFEPDTIGQIKPQHAKPDAPSCSAGRTRIVVGVDGSVYPCIDFTEALGNIRKQSISDIWSGSTFNDVRELKRFSDPICRVCPDRAFCFRCPASIELDTGDPTKPSENTCMIARTKRKVHEEQMAGILAQNVEEDRPLLAAQAGVALPTGGCSGCGSAQKEIENLLQKPSLFVTESGT